MKIWRWLVKGWNIVILLFVVLPIVVGLVQGLGKVVIDVYLVDQWNTLVYEQEELGTLLDNLIDDTTATNVEWFGRMETNCYQYLDLLNKMDSFLNRYGKWLWHSNDITRIRQIIEDDRTGTLELLVIVNTWNMREENKGIK